MEHEHFMREAMLEAERARGSTGDNPWVGCIIVDDRGQIVARGHTQGPGEDHAEIVALRSARALAVDLAQATLYSTLEPCSFHGRTPACAKVIATSGVGCVVTALRDPNPRVDGLGVHIVQEAHIPVIEGVCEREVRHQLAPWFLREHPHEPVGWARAIVVAGGDPVAGLVARYAISVDDAERLARAAREAASRG